MKILRNITNISSGASLPLFSHLHTGSPHPDTPFLIQPHPPHHFTTTTATPILDECGWGYGRRRCKCHCCCVCVSAVGWQRNNNNAACPTSFIRLHKLIRPRRSHHLLYWEWRQNTGTKCGTWVAECVPILVCLHVLEGVCNEINVQCAFKMGNWKCVSLFYSRGGTLCGSYKFAK